MRRLSPLLGLLVHIACANEETSSSFGGQGDTGTSTGDTTGPGGLPTTSAAMPGSSSTGTGVGTTAVSSSSSSESTGDDTTTTTAVDPDTGDSSSGTSTTDTSSSSGEPPAATCDDQQHNQDETDVDCGGATCGACALGDACGDDVDCASGWCDGGACTDPGCLADSDCDDLDGACIDAWCNLESKQCDLSPILEAMACEGDLCSIGDMCSGGVCGGGTPRDCSALDNVCGTGVCNDETGACVANPIPAMDGLACDDGFVCTPNDSCVAGQCGVGGPGFLFFEDFSDPDPAWELPGQWQIGPAVASDMGKNGSDPGDDHSPGDDAMLAGTAIGSLMPPGALSQQCLTTPVVDASGQATLWLTLWRHLHTDYFPYAIHTVEVWNGGEWVVVDVGYLNPGIDDLDWTQVSYDLGAHANDMLQARICYTTIDGVKDWAGWSVDDLTIGPFVCTPGG